MNKQYMYTPYRGKEFIEEFLADRRLHQEKLPARQAKERSLETSPQGSFDLFDESLSEFETADVLGALLKKLQTPDSKVEPRVKWWVDQFVRRYEVTQKIHRRYNRQWKKVDTYEEDSALYVLLSEICFQMHRLTGNFKYFNTSLKLNDFLTQQDLSHQTQEALDLFQLCLKHEYETIERLLLNIKMGSR